MTHRVNQFLDDQSRVFADSDGRAWAVRIEQGGGTPSLTADSAPVPVLIFRALDAEAPLEVSIAGDVGEWELTEYSERRLRALLGAAQVHAKESTAE